LFLCNQGVPCLELHVQIRDTREEWPLLAVEAEVNEDSKSKMKGVIP
jgi:hypothetical protein